MPGHSVMGRVATFDSSRVTWPEKPGSMKPAVEWVRSPSRPSDDFPSSLAETSFGSVISSSVDANTNSPGWSTNGSVGSTSTSRVSSGWCAAGSMTEYLWLSKRRKYRSRHTSMLAGWMRAGSYGSRLTRPAEISALMSRSERRLTRPMYRALRGDAHTARNAVHAPRFLRESRIRRVHALQWPLTTPAHVGAFPFQPEGAGRILPTARSCATTTERQHCEDFEKSCSCPRSSRRGFRPHRRSRFRFNCFPDHGQLRLRRASGQHPHRWSCHGEPT